jgi:hypothetical protein
MQTTREVYVAMVAVGMIVLLTVASTRLYAQRSADAALHLGDRDLGGVVSGPQGPEAGV